MLDKFPSPSDLRKLTLQELDSLVQDTVGKTRQGGPADRINVSTLTAEVSLRLEGSNNRDEIKELTRMQEALTAWLLANDRPLRKPRDGWDNRCGACMCSVQSDQA